jgi:hypothetical protein
VNGVAEKERIGKQLVFAVPESSEVRIVHKADHPPAAVTAYNGRSRICNIKIMIGNVTAGQRIIGYIDRCGKMIFCFIKKERAVPKQVNISAPVSVTKRMGNIKPAVENRTAQNLCSGSLC